MNIMRFGSRVIESSSPFALLATGAALAAAFPPVRRTLRSAAVLTTRGALSITDSVKQLGNQIKINTSGIIAEAREARPLAQGGAVSETLGCFKDSIKNQSRQLAVATTASALTLSDKAKSLKNDFKEVIAEARSGMETNASEGNTVHESSHITSGETLVGENISPEPPLDITPETNDSFRRRTKKPVQ